MCSLNLKERPSKRNVAEIYGMALVTGIGLKFELD